MPVHVVRELVGHEDLATTQKYAEVIDADKGPRCECSGERT
jgi:site-specific recombinase XerD